MNNKLVTGALVLTIIGLLGLVFYVKKDSAQQAKDYVKETMTKVEKKLKSDKELRENNNQLWELVLTIKDAKPNRKEIVSLAKKWCSTPERKEVFSINATKGTEVWSLGWSKVNVTLTFSKAGKLEGMDLSQLLGK